MKAELGFARRYQCDCCCEIFINEETFWEHMKSLTHVAKVRANTKANIEKYILLKRGKMKLTLNRFLHTEKGTVGVIPELKKIYQSLNLMQEIIGLWRNEN